MKRLLMILCFFVLLVGCEQEEQRDPEFLEVGDVSTYTDTTYYLDLTLDVDLTKLYVKGDIVYVNETLETNELYINLYANSDNRFGNRNNVENLVVTIDGITYNPETFGDYDTSLRYLLDEDLVIGENVHIEFEYEFVYWNHDRLVYSQDYFVSMFFYPFVAVFDESGWNIDEYTFRGESYYNTIGDYYVTINVPTEYKVASSGKLLDTRYLEEERTETDYFLDDGRDFSFSASSLYEVYEREIDGIHHKIYAKGALTEQEVEESFTYLEVSFRVFNEYIGPYYYDYFTLEYGDIYGMESSSIIYCSREISEHTVVHEVVHQWFYSIIGNDQGDYSFLDESLTTFASGIYYYDLYGREGADGSWGYRNSLQERLSDYYNESLGTNMIRKVNNYQDLYGFIIYYHGPTMFRYYFDEFLDGDFDVLKEILNEYYDRYHGKEVSLDEFLDLWEELSGETDTKEWFLMNLDEIQDLDNRP